MTVSSTTRIVTHVGNSIATVFPYGFRIIDSTHVVVSLLDLTTLVETVLTPSEFSISGIGNAAGGDVTYPLTGSPITSNIQLIIKRDVPYLQPFDIVNQAGFFPEPLERQLDLTTMQIQQQVEALGRAPKFREGSTFSDVTLPDPEAGKILGETATGYENVDPNTLFPGQTDATGPFADRSTYDAQAEGFRFLATDLSPPLLYIRETAVAGTWSPGLPWGRGPQGDPGEAVKDAVYVPGTMVIEFDSDTLPSNAFLWANFETIGDVGSGADHESADYFDAFTNLKNSVWNVGTEDWDAGNVVRLPDRRGLTTVGASAMGEAPQVVLVQRATTIDTTNLSATATVASLTGVSVGMFILGNPNVPAGTTVSSINTGAGTIVMSANATATAATVATRFSVISDPNVAGSTGGADIHALIEAQLAAHPHDVDDSGHDHANRKSSGFGVTTGGSAGLQDDGSPDQVATGLTVNAAGGDQPHPSVQPVVVVNHIVYVAPAQVGPSIVPVGIGDRVWQWAGTTGAAAPGDGKIAANGALSSGGADELYIDDQDVAGIDLSALTLDFKAGDSIILFNLTRRGKFWKGTVVDVPAHPAGYVRINNLTYGTDVDGAGFVIGDEIALSLERGGTSAAIVGTSTTNLTVGTGSKVFTLNESTLSYSLGQRLRAASDDGLIFMEGLVTAFGGTSLTMNVTTTGGAGSHADWNINIAGQPGSGDMLSTNNLSDLADAATARTNLGLGALAVLATVDTAQIDNDAVTYAKIQNVVANNVLLGNITGAGGIVAEITAAQVRTMIGVEAGATADQTAADIRGLGFFDITNDGAGSGLDADLLDGVQGASFTLLTDLASVANGDGASLVGVEDSGGLITATTVEGALAEIATDVAALDAAVVLQGTWDASVGTFPGGGTAQAGASYIVSVGGTVDSVVFTANDRIVAITDNASTTVFAANWHKLDYTDAVLSVASKTGAVVLAAADIVSGTFADARVAASNVTQHVAAIDHDALTNFTANEHFTQAAIVATGVLASGSITTTFGNIDIGASTFDTTGAVSTGILTVTGAILPNANDGGALGVSGTAFSDLFLASGAVINFNAGAETLTHSANTLALVGAISEDNVLLTVENTVTAGGEDEGAGFKAISGTREFNCVVSTGSDSAVFFASGIAELFFNTDTANLIFVTEGSGIIEMASAEGDYSMWGGESAETPVLSFYSSELTVVATDVLAAIRTSAPDETSGGDAILLAGALEFVASGTFDATNNPTDLVVKLGISEAATEKWRFLSVGGATTKGVLAGAILTLQTSEPTVVETDILGRIDFQAPDEADGGDGALVSASMRAEAAGTFDATNNPTSLVFSTGLDGAVVDRMTLNEAGISMSGSVSDAFIAIEIINTATGGGDEGVGIFMEAGAASVAEMQLNEAEDSFFFACEGVSSLTFQSSGGEVLFRADNGEFGFEATATQPAHIRLYDGSDGEIAANDVLGKISFISLGEPDGGDAMLEAGAIQFVAGANFTATVNLTDLVILLGISEAATEHSRFVGDGGFMPPQFTTGGLPTASAHEGEIVYDTTTNTMKWSNGTSWATI